MAGRMAKKEKESGKCQGWQGHRQQGVGEVGNVEAPSTAAGEEEENWRRSAADDDDDDDDEADSQCK